MATKLKYQGVEDQIVSSSLHRQAIINGNFDVWQRGTSGFATGGAYNADRWADYHDSMGGTNPTITITRQTLTPGAIDNSFYIRRLAVDGAGSSLGSKAIGITSQKIEYGTRFLCGDGKKVTVSFWARSDITGKKIGTFLSQNYGTGGSPTVEETLSGDNWTLTSTWTKYTKTFTTNTLSGKTFGTNNNDYISLYIATMWGTDRAARVDAGTTAEDYGGAGYIDIAQVQLCAGDVALPFQPKSFEEELSSCYRYYQKSFEYETAIGAITNIGATYGPQCVETNKKPITTISLNKTMRTIPTITTYSGYSSTANKIYRYVAGTEVDKREQKISSKFIVIDSSAAISLGDFYIIHWVADAEL